MVEEFVKRQANKVFLPVFYFYVLKQITMNNPSLSPVDSKRAGPLFQTLYFRVGYC